MKKSAWGRAAVAAFVTLFLLVNWRANEPEAFGSTQRCNTECQSKMTDCILGCDGLRPCEEACKRQGATCVAICSSDAGPPVPPMVDASDEESTDVQIVVDARAEGARDARNSRRDR